MDNGFILFLKSFIITIILLIFFIPFFRKVNFSQSIRIEGPSTHYHKSGTPTMGGVFIILTLIIVFSIYYFNKKDNDLNKFILLLFPPVCFSLIGFIDDGLIIKKKNNNGIKPKTKLFLQIIVSVVYFILYYNLIGDTTIKIFKLKIEFGFLYSLFVIFMFVASSNAVNLTDGLDGLVSGVLIVILIGIGTLSLNKDIDISIFSIILIGSILGFLCYNFHPAKLFMGDVGSLALGATIANLFVLLKMEFLLIIFGFMFIVETISVMLQVWYFKKTKGKRLFLMTPIHHHLELKGLKEWQIDFIFWIITIIMGTIGIYLGCKFY